MVHVSAFLWLKTQKSFGNSLSCTYSGGARPHRYDYIFEGREGQDAAYKEIVGVAVERLEAIPRGL